MSRIETGDMQSRDEYLAKQYMVVACFSQHVLARNRSGLSHLSRSGSLGKFTAIRRVRLPEPTPPTSD